MMNRWTAAVLLFAVTWICSPVFAGYTCYNDCVRWAEDGTAAHVTSWTIHDGSDPGISAGALKDFSTGLEVPAQVSFSMGAEGLAVSGSSGSNPAPDTEAYELFGNAVDFSGPIVYYGGYGWFVEIKVAGLDPDRMYTFAGTAIRGSHYPNRQSQFKLIGAVSAVNKSSEGVLYKDSATTILLAGDNSETGYVVRWDNIRVADDGTGTGSFIIRAEASDYTNNLDASSNDRGRAYPLNGFMLQEIDFPPADCPAGDLDGDCIVSLTDLVELAGSWLQTGHLAANLDGIGSVNGSDFAILAGNWLADNQTGSLEVILEYPAPMDAQWQVDGGPWHNSGKRVDGLKVGAHTIAFSDVEGWNKPANRVIDIRYNEKTTIHEAYSRQTGSISVTIAEPKPAGAHWRVDGGAWQASGAVVDDLSEGTHLVEYAVISGWDVPAEEEVTVAANETTFVTVTYIQQTGSVTVSILPAAAIAAGAQWRIDGGPWRDSGSTEYELSVGSHVVQYRSIDNWDAPPDATADVYKNQTTAVSGTYAEHTGSLQVTIASPVPAGAKWRVGGGAWRDSGETVHNLPVGIHIVEYADLAGYDKPQAESVAIIKDMLATATGAYIRQTGSLTVRIEPAEASALGAQWRLSNGQWQTGGTTLSGIETGTYTIEYMAVTGWTAPPNQQVTIVNKQTTSMTGTYVQKTGSLSVTISSPVPEGAQWRVNGGIWRNSGELIDGLAVGEHAVSYSEIADHDSPTDEVVTVSENQTTSITRAYVPHKGSLTVTLDPAEAVGAGAQWRIEDGEWHDSGVTITDLKVGTYSVAYRPIPGWDTPVGEIISIMKDHTATVAAAYVQQTGSLAVTIMPAAAAADGARWRVDGGDWNESGVTQTNLAVGTHIVEYSELAGWAKPGNAGAEIQNGQTTTLQGVYTQQTGSLRVMIHPQGAINAGAQWQVDGGAWQDSGSTVSGLSIGIHTVSYKPTEGWTAPTDATADIVADQTTDITGTYSEQVGAIQVLFDPAAPGAQWRVDGGAWNDGGAIVAGLSAGTHALAYSTVSDHDKPADETVEVVDGQTTVITRGYIRHTGSLTVAISPAEAVDAGAQWRTGGGQWRNSGSTASGLPVGDHTVEFSAIADWDTPTERIVTIFKDQTTSANGTYIRHTGSLTVTIDPLEAVAAGAQWRVNAGAWNNSGQTVGGLVVGEHTVEFRTIANWDAPHNAAAVILKDQTAAISGTYIQHTGSITVTISPVEALAEGARWRVDGGEWHTSGATIQGLPAGDYLVQFDTINDWDAPASETVTVEKDQTVITGGVYVLQTGSVSVTIAAPVPANAKWRIDGGSWHDSGQIQSGLRVGNHSLSFSDVPGWDKPDDETVHVVKDQTTALTRSYSEQVGSLTATITPAEAVLAGAQWRVDAGPWRNSGYTESGLAVGVHTVRYSTVSGWDEPADETVDVFKNQTTSAQGTYVLHTGSLQVSLSPTEAIAAGAQWRVDGGGWNDSGSIVSGLATGQYTVEYTSINGWNEPPSETVNVLNGQTTTISRSYEPTTGSLSVVLEPAEVRSAGARWRVDGGEWLTSGSLVPGLASGGHLVEYSSVTNWASPTIEIVNIEAGLNTVITRTYTQQLGSITVTIYPQEAVDAGANWRVDSGDWQASGATVSNLSAGWHTIEYLALAGWTKPANETILLNESETATTSGTYIMQSWPKLSISEFMASNGTTLLDQDGDASDWIEIYNPTGDAVDLDGWHLTDTASDLTRWRIPAVTIEAGGFVVVFASGKDRSQPGSELHTNFSLSADGEYLALAAPDGSVIASYEPQYPTQLRDISYGLAHFASRLIDEGAEVRYVVPTSADAAADWTTASFDDSAWKTGKTGLGFGVAADEGMVAYYPMDEGSGTVLHDAVGGHDGQLRGAVNWVPGPLDGALGTALNFGGSGGDHVDLGRWNPSEGTGQLTVAHWLYWRGGGATWQGSMGKRDTWSAGNMMWQVELTLNSNPQGYLEFKREGSTPGFGFTMPTNEWVHVAVTFNGSTATMYRNGLPIGTDGFSFGYNTESTLTIGACEVNGGNPWNGMIDEVRLYNRALTAEEVAALATGGGVGTSLQDEMLGTNASLWCRIPFQVEDPAVLDALELRMKYEDGFVAYLNGTEVARRNAGGSVNKTSWNAAAASDRPDEDAKAYESIGLTPFIELLNAHPAKNILAIHGLNDHISNGEFMIFPVLIGASNVETPQYFTTPTPGAHNVAGAVGLVGDVDFSVERGFCTAPFDLTLTTASPEAEIYYTLNGSTPSASNGTLYEGAISVAGTTTVRAIAVKAGYLSSKVETHTYLFIDDVLTQSPAGEAPGPGWPTDTVNSQRFKYGMNPQIVVQDSRYNTLVDDALLALPSISLVTDLKHLFDPTTGIYVNAWQDGRAWERPTSVELLNPDGTDGFQIDAGLRIRGGYSRSGDNPKHAFRLFFRSEYGDSRLRYPLFGDEGVDSFDKVDLRTAQNYSWSFGGDSRNTMLREVFSRDTQRDMGQPYTRSRYYHLYINGHYWGIFQTQERSEARFGESYLGGNVEDYDVVKVDTGAGYTIHATDGNLDAWQRVWEAAIAGFETDEVYYRIQGMNVDGTDNPDYERLVDIYNLMDYMITTYFVGDFDGPVSNFLGNQSPNNFYGVYNRNSRDGFQFFRHDAEHSLFWGWDRTGPWPAGEAFNKFNPQWLHQRLTGNPEYRLHFADRVHRHFYNGGTLTPEANVARFNARRETIDLAIIAESARWGGANLNRNDQWLPEVNWIVNSYFPARSDEVLGQFRRQNWYPETAAPLYSQNGGHVPAGFELIMSNPNGAGEIHYTTDGSDPRLPIRLSAPGGAVTLIQENAAKRVLIPTEDLQGGTGSIYTEYWFGIEGAAVSDLTQHHRYPGSPSSSEYRTSFEIPTDWADYYGTRMRGYLHPPGTGNYTFWIASDDASELWLSTDANPGNAERIAWIEGWCPSRDFDNQQGTDNPHQRSSPISLTGGQRYYIEALQKEHGGGDNLAVAWQGPDINNRSVIAGQYLSPAAMVWHTNDFDDSAWMQGSGGVGFERNPGDPINYTSLIGIDVESAMYNKNGTCYIRIPFTVDNPDLSALTLRVRYDDGFIAWLNGSEVARRNYSGAPEWNATADTSHADSAAVVFEDIDLSAHIGKLRTGGNLLAIQGLNVTANSNDFLISVEMIGAEISQGDPSPGAALYTGPVALTESTRVKARVLSGQWSAMNDFTFAVGPVAENLRITEIMYHPTNGDEEFVEMTNTGTEAINLNLVQFTRGIRFTFPSVWLSPGEYVLIVRDTAAFEARYGTGLNVVGQYEGALDNSGERLALVDAAGAAIHDFVYKDTWYDITDGPGFSLTIRDATAPLDAWGSKSGWRPSAYAGGSPGYDDSGVIPDPGAIVINEVLAHSHGEAPDWLELHNTTPAAINIGGWFLSDNPGYPTKYEISPGVSIPAHGYVVFYENLHFNNQGDTGCHQPFAFSENGEAAILTSGEGGVITGYTAEESFGASETDVAFGRYQKSTGSFNFVPMSVNTPGYPNAYPKVGPVVISEIMYNPPGNPDAEYVELLNITGSNVAMYDYETGEPWIFEDDGGIAFSFPTPPVVMSPGERILLIKDSTAFFATFAPAPGTQIFAWYTGALNNAGEKIQLSKPGDVDSSGKRYYIRVDRVVYSDGSHPVGGDPWPVSADGAGDALHRINAADYGNDVINWHAAAPTPGW